MHRFDGAFFRQALSELFEFLGDCCHYLALTTQQLKPDGATLKPNHSGMWQLIQNLIALLALDATENQKILETFFGLVSTRSMPG